MLHLCCIKNGQAYTRDENRVLKLFVVKYLITCYYIAEADGAEGDEGVVETFGVAPAFKVHESERGQDEEDHEARYQI